MKWCNITTPYITFYECKTTEYEPWILQNLYFSLRLQYRCFTSLSFHTLVMKDVDNVLLQPDDILELSSNVTISVQFCTRLCYVTEERYSDKDKCETNWPGGVVACIPRLHWVLMWLGFLISLGKTVLFSVFTVLIIIISFLMHPFINRIRATNFQNCPLPCYYND
jgi:hypothetical protein